ncbi:uncharacterized protein LOC121991306, partial [Zingiber officinale]|uniref:uncharacterized protein LOC121991306 n=1 Tax=Zingiber officinale TaxID=94328 RepID=UPI001C4C5067
SGRTSYFYWNHRLLPPCKHNALCLRVRESLDHFSEPVSLDRATGDGPLGGEAAAAARGGSRRFVVIFFYVGSVLEGGEGGEGGGTGGRGVVSSGASPRLAPPYECIFQYYPRLRRGLQLLGTPPLPALQIWISDLGVQVGVFYSVRLFFGLISTITDTYLVVALSRKYGKRVAWYTLAMLCLTSGYFFASTTTVVIDSFPGLFRDKYAVEDSLIVMIAKGLRPIFLGIILCASHSGTFSILNGYFAPLEIYKHLDHHNAIGNGKVFFCFNFELELSC